MKLQLGKNCPILAKTVQLKNSFATSLGHPEPAWTLGLRALCPESPRLFNYSLTSNFKRAEVVQESPPILLFKYLSIYIYEDFLDIKRLNPHGYWLADVREKWQMHF